MTEIQNTKHVRVIEYWNFEFFCILVLVIWNFKNWNKESCLPVRRTLIEKEFILFFFNRKGHLRSVPADNGYKNR